MLLPKDKTQIIATIEVMAQSLVTGEGQKEQSTGEIVT